MSASWADDVAPAEKKRRVARLIAAGASAWRIFLDGQVGGTLEVLVESADGNGSVSGLSGNYAEVVFPGGPGRVGELVGVRIASARDGRLAGSVA